LLTVIAWYCYVLLVVDVNGGAGIAVNLLMAPGALMLA
jgi:hypothetical protein